MSIQSRLACLTVAVLAGACVDHDALMEPAAGTASFDISDAGHGGNSHFAFLPPLVASVPPGGAFDPSASPEVRICEFAGGSCAGGDLAEFTMTTGTGSEVIRMDPVAEQYIVDWHTGDFALVTGAIYRIRVYLGGQLLGYADVNPIDGGKGLKNASTGEAIALKDGSTLPIKFRIEEGAVVSNPVPVFSSDEREPIGIGVNHSCALVPGGAAWCWGDNSGGQLGQGVTGPASVSPVMVPGHTFVQLIAGFGYTCGLDSAGAAWCWGANGDGQLGRGTFTVSEPTPALVSGGHVFAALSGGGFFACGRTTSGEIWCWGDNGVGQLGNGGYTKSSTPTKVVIPGNPTITWFDVGGGFGCGLTAAGEAWCWGQNIFGQLGRGFTSSGEAVPAVAVAGTSFSMILGGGGYACGITMASETLCWGANGSGQLGRGTFTTAEITPGGVVGSPTYARIYAGFFQACGVTPAGEAQCWGENTFGQLGVGVLTNQDPYGIATPTATAGGDVFVSMAGGLIHFCGITINAQAKCWGRNNTYQLGDPVSGYSTTPVPVSGGLTFAKP